MVLRRSRTAAGLAGLLVAAAAAVSWTITTQPAIAALGSLTNIVPVPVSVQASPGVTYTLPSTASVYPSVGPTDVGNYLAGILRRSTGYALPVTAAPATPASGISLLLNGADPALGAEGYTLQVTASMVVIRAQTNAGLFHGAQTLRQILPPQIEAATVQTGPWQIPGGMITDRPRFAYRGTMLDVARHFHPVSTLKEHIDRVALYKINTLHLHLSDDQGWRIVIDQWPRLATHGGSTPVGGGAGGL